MTGILLPSKLKKFSAGAEITKMEEERQAKQKKQQQQNELRDAFMAREIHPEAVTRINKAIRIAAEQGHHQLEVALFLASSAAMAAGGSTLQIRNGQAHSRVSRRRPTSSLSRSCAAGYKLHAEIISYPAGMPGEVGLYLKW